MADWEVSQLAVRTVPALGDYAPLLVPTDTTTPPAGAGGSDQRATLGKLLGQTVWPSGDTTGVKDAAALNAAVTAIGTSSGTITLMPGQWYWKPGAVSAIQLANAQTLVIDGGWGAVVNAVGGASGDMLRMYNPNSQGGTFGGNTFSVRSGVRGLTIDGTNAAAGSTGLHIGDIMNAQADVIITNFSGAGSIGLHLDNTVSWTEEADIRAYVRNCTSQVVFEVTTGYDSFGYGNYDFTVEALPLQDGVVLKNGVILYNGSLRIRGNFYGSSNAANTSHAVFRASGVCPVGSPNAGGLCKIFAMRLDWQVECGSGTGTNAPATMILDTTNFVVMFQNTGIVSFNNTAGLAFTQAQTAGTGLNQFQFAGIFVGDPSLSLSSGQGYQATSQPAVIYTNSLGVFAGQGNLPTTRGDFFDVGQLSANTTVTVNYFGGNTLGVAQRATVRIKQAASGGPYTVAWQHNASPTLSSPTILWAGGTAPTMSTAANAVDIYTLETFDGITWFGRVFAQNVS